MYEKQEGNFFHRSLVELLQLFGLTYCCTQYHRIFTGFMRMCADFMFSYFICMCPMSEHCKGTHKLKLIFIWKEEWTINSFRWEKKKMKRAFRFFNRKTNYMHINYATRLKELNFILNYFHHCDTFFAFAKWNNK